jgi:nucleotide-binding universal stress UspA family protein
MAIKRILLPLCDTVGIEPIAEAAFLLGRLFKAQIRGLFARPLEGPSCMPDENFSLEKLKQAIEKAGWRRAECYRQTCEIFKDCAHRFADVDADFASTNGGEEVDLASAARVADLSILGSGARFAGNGWGKVRYTALFGSGRPVLLTPPAGSDVSTLTRLVIGWKDSLEAARAVAAAHPFLALAENVHLVAVGETDQSLAVLDQIEQYLRLHHAAVRSSVIPASGRTVGDALLHRCETLGGALLVMGAYSHGRWRERVFGGVTEHVLNKARIPVLMVH